MKSLVKHLLAPLMIGALASTAQAADLPKRTFCVFDIVGKSGPVFSMMTDYKLEALKWGVDLEIKPFTDEKIAAEEFKAGKCDSVGITGMRGRAFNAFTGTLDSIGSIPDYDLLRVVIEKLSADNPKMKELMRSGEFEVVGIAPAGAAFLFVNDRTIDTVNELSGKKVAVLDFDKSQAVMVESIGASPVTVSIANVGTMFNNRAVDVIGAPSVAYEPLELYKGLGDKGGIVNFALAQLTVQVMTRHDRFPADYGQKSRAYIFGQFDRTMSEINKSTKAVKPSYWIELPEKDKEGYMEMFRQSRLKLREQGIYDGRTLKFLSLVRCAVNPALAECTAADRE